MPVEEELSIFHCRECGAPCGRMGVCRVCQQARVGEYRVIRFELDPDTTIEFGVSGEKEETGD